MSEIQCPSCKGSKQFKVAHVKYAPGYKGPPVTEIPCIVCDGAGTITDVREQRMERGGKFHKYRVDFLQLGLRKAAELWGINAVQLSYIEQGRVETDWVPPGFLDWVRASETEEPILASKIRKAIDPVAHWFDCEEGDPLPLVEIVAEIAKMLAEERQDTLRYRKALQDIIGHQQNVVGPSLSPTAITIKIAKKALQDDLADTIAKAWRNKPLDSPSLVKGDGSKDSDSRLLRAMTLQFKPELTHSVWVDTYLSDDNDCQLPRDQLVERLKQGVRDGEWVAWRLIHIEQEVMGNVD